MSRRANINYTAGGTDFDVVLGVEPFLRKDLQALQAAVEAHDHTATKGLPVARIGVGVVGTSNLVALSVDSSILAANAVTTPKITDLAVTSPKLADGVATGTKLGSDVVTLTGAQTLTNKILTSPTLSNVTTVDGAIREDRGADVASASTVTLGDDGNTFLITGTTTITTLNVKPAGTVVRLIFNAILTLTDGVGTLRLNGNFLTSSEASIELVSMGSYWQEISRTDPFGGKMAFGSYTGNATGARTIPLPFTPKHVVVQENGSPESGTFWNFLGAGAVIFVGDLNSVHEQAGMSLTTNGFIVGASGSAANGSGTGYTYAAYG